MVDLIRDHHDSSAPASATLDCLRVADQVVRYNQIGDSGNPWRDSEPAAAPERFGEDIESLMVQMGSLDRIVAEARMFAQLANEG